VRSASCETPLSVKAAPMKIVFLHGWHSVPGGVKPSYLAQHGNEVINSALSDDEFGGRIEKPEAKNFILGQAHFIHSRISTSDKL
jgi:hypothetical protein